MDLIEKPVLNETQLKPRVGFLGVGWIGLNRMNAIREQTRIKIEAIADIEPGNLEQAKSSAPDATLCYFIEELLQENLNGVVIATPSALHASQSIYALENGASVFCQKPLGRTAKETREVVETAQKHNRLLGVDFSYRFTEGMQKIYHLIQSGAFGNIYAVNLIFHNAYGPDKKWFYDPELSGGGCVIDLGSHLIDLALWALNFPSIEKVTSSLFSQGKILRTPKKETEDYAVAAITTDEGTAINLSCSWNLHAGQDAIIEASFYGSAGGAFFRNVNGSFYHFEAFRSISKTSREQLSNPPDSWGGKAAIDWANRLTRGEGFNKSAFEFIQVAEIIDRIYNREI